MYNILRWACCQKFHSYLLYNNLARVNGKIKEYGLWLWKVMDRYWSTQPCIHPNMCWTSYEPTVLHFNLGGASHSKIITWKQFFLTHANHSHKIQVNRPSNMNMSIDFHRTRHIQLTRSHRTFSYILPILNHGNKLAHIFLSKLNS
jgi:hypothetical protein